MGAERDTDRNSDVHSDSEWYFDLHKGIAVPADERGPGDHMLGPYPTKGQAENWKATNETRNESWDADDERWNSWGEEADDTRPG